MNTIDDPRIRAYLKDLATSLHSLPERAREEILSEIRSHISARMQSRAPMSAGDIEELLDTLGTPEEIALAAGVPIPQQAQSPRGTREVAAQVLLLVGGVVLPVVGWLCGVVLLWSSTVWTRRDKIIGTLVVPGGLLLPAALAVLPAVATPCKIESGSSIFLQHCGGGGVGALTALVFAISVVGSMFTAVWLARHPRPR